MAGSTIYSDSKLMYFPTHHKIVHQIVGIVGSTYVKGAFDSVKKGLNPTLYQEATMQILDNDLNHSTGFYHYFVENERYNLIKEFLGMRYSYSSSDKTVSTILDPFAGEGEFLTTFKDVITENNLSKPYLVANELEANRYNKINEDERINESYNGAFEDLNQIPTNSISLLLYNPPYGNTNGVRNVKHYLQMIIERKLIHNSVNTKGYINGWIVMVIRKDDLLDTLPLIVSNFEINKRCLYKVHKEEYDKFKQFVIFAQLRKEPIDINHSLSATSIQNEIQELTNLINSEPEFNGKMYEERISLPDLPYLDMKANHEYISNTNDVIHSDLNNSNWKWIKELTQMKDFSEITIDKALPPKVGELSNIIASGMINGEIYKDGKLSHIVVGGTTSKMREETEKSTDENGESITITGNIRYSEPYLNVLVSENGELKIKELTGGGTLD